MVFFFQAEDGIRDLVRSRGLGDVYKRQAEHGAKDLRHGAGMARQVERDADVCKLKALDIDPVSYTHLTLPTSDLV